MKGACVLPYQTIGRSLRILADPGVTGDASARAGVRHALFDFDGTLSLLRAGWQEVMVDYFVEVLADAAPGSPRAELETTCVEFITRLTGRQTIYQALELEARVRDLGGRPLPAADYKAEYLRRLHTRIDHRRQALRSGAEPAARHLVPGSVKLLSGLRAAGVTCYLASGTDEPFVLEEAELLGLTDFFRDDATGAPRIHGALEDYKAFSKRMVIERIVADHGLSGTELVAFGDGFVEIEEARRAGGIAVGVASREDGGDGFDPWKAERLAGVGAHLLAPDWREAGVLLDWLGIRA